MYTEYEEFDGPAEGAFFSVPYVIADDRAAGSRSGHPPVASGVPGHHAAVENVERLDGHTGAPAAVAEQRRGDAPAGRHARCRCVLPDVAME